ncbi:hypothetical protein AB0I76_05985, partial [Micromonospora sp. NPDC049799]
VGGLPAYRLVCVPVRAEQVRPKMADEVPAAPAEPAFAGSGGISVGTPTVAYPTIDALPRRAAGEPAAPVLPVGPVAGPVGATASSAAPGANGSHAGVPRAGGAGLGANLAATAPLAPPTPVVPRSGLPAEAPIFREMEAVWFRSHGNDATAIFARPDFDQPPAAAPTAGPSTAAPSTRPKLPTRTPGTTATPAPTQPPPPSYAPPVSRTTTPAAPAPATPASAPPPATPVAAPAATDPDEAWRTAADEGWTRASKAAEPSTAGTTRSGLPKRVPQAQLVPGGIEPRGGPDRSRRTPDDVRGLLSAYHRGVQRGRAAGTDQNSTSTTKETSR